MRLRGPSFGFLYLVLAIGLFFAFFAWIRQPMWWDLEDPRARDLAEIDYLLRIAGDGPERKAGLWLGDALKVAVRQSEWALAEKVLATARGRGVEIGPSALVPVAPGRCFAVGFDGGRWTMGTDPAALFLKNGSTAAMTVRAFLTSNRAAQGAVRDPAGAPEKFDFEPGAEFSFERVVPPGGEVFVEVRASPEMFKKWERQAQRFRTRGFRLDRVEVSP
ncbi:MAG: hypothetical protein NXI31_12515 [bacterium]|nr:hypothetical protein [bacterium]